MKKRPEADRVTVDFADLGIPEIVLLGRNEYQQARPPLAPHVHPGVFEVVVLENGVQTYFLGKERYDLQGSDVFITKPDELHSTGGEPENRGRLYWLEFRSVEKGSSFLGLTAAESAMLIRRFWDLSARHFHHGDVLVPTLQRIFAAYADRENPLRAAELRNLLLRFLLDTIDGGESRLPIHYSPGIRRAVERIDRELSESLNVSELARGARMSESYFKLLFKRETGMPPMEYAIWKRIERAKQWLKNSDLPITRIATDSGFISSQHFATVFKRLTGVTPTVFRSNAGVPTENLPPAAGSGRAFHPASRH